MAYTYAAQFTQAIVSVTPTAGIVGLPGYPVHVYAVGTTTHVTLYTSRTKGTTTANPTSVDVAGNLTFFADPGQYDLVFTPPAASAQRVTIEIGLDPSEVVQRAGGTTASAAVLPFLNVKDYGATGDGTTDDTTAILAAFAAGKNVFLPPGTYRTSLLTINSSSTVKLLFGVPGQSILKYINTDPGGAANTLILGINGTTDVVVDGVVFDGNSAVLTSFPSTVVSFNAQRVHFTRCVFQNTRGIGLLFSTNIVECSVENSRFYNVGFTGGLTGVNWFEGVAFSEGTPGNSYRNIVANNTFQDIGSDAISIPAMWDMIVSGNFTNNHGAAGVYGQSVKHCTITGNVIRSGPSTAATPGSGIDLDLDESCTITGNVVYETAAIGITITGKNTTVAGNSCINNKQDSSVALFSGIYVKGSGHTIVGNACTDTQAVKTQQYGVIIDTAATGLKVANNTVAGNALGGYATVNFSVNQAVAVSVDNALVAAATLTLSPWHDVVFVSGNTGITSITAAATDAARRVTLVFSGTPTVTDGSNLKLAGNFVATADDSITLVCDGTNWIETSRSVN